MSNLNHSKYLGLSSVICFFEIGGKTGSQVNIPECAVVISWMEISYMGPRFTKAIVIRYFLVKEDHQRKKKRTVKKKTVQEMVAESIGGSGQQSTDDNNKQECCNRSTNEIILEAELDQAREDLQDMQEKESYTQKHYTVSELSAEVLRMETGLPTEDV